jgi:hypothetical protein
MNPTASTGRVAGLLHCARWSHLVVCNSNELLRYAKQGWPKCCGEVMPLYTASEKAPEAENPDKDTKFN